METPLQKNHKKPPLVKLENITTADFRRLLGRLKGAENIKNIDHKRSVLAEISQDLTACQARFFRTNSARPKPEN